MQKYLLSPVILSGGLISYLIGHILDDSGLAQSICKFSSPSIKLSKRYDYFSLRYTVKDDKASILILMVTKKYPFSELYVLWLLFLLCYSLHTVMFLDCPFLTIAVGVTFTSSSLISSPKTLEYVLALLEVEYSNTMVASELSGVDFLLTSFWWFNGLFFQLLSLFLVALPFCLHLLSYKNLDYNRGALMFCVLGRFSLRCFQISTPDPEWSWSKLMYFSPRCFKLARGHHNEL